MTAAVVVTRPGVHGLVARRPLPLHAGEALIRVHAGGVCRGDRDVLRGTRPTGYVRYPLTPGHEWSGTVERVGDGVPDGLRGRKVVGESIRNCQVCERCHAGENTLCESGYEEAGFTQPGALAETLTLPARFLHVLADTADLTAAALLEPAACAAAAVLEAAVRPGESAAVLGDGTPGLLAVQFLRAACARRLTVVGSHPARRERSLASGAEAFAAPGDPVPGGFDLVVETTGSAEAVRTAAGLLRDGGRLISTSTAWGAGGLDPRDLVRRQLTVQSVFGAPSAAWTHAVEAFTAGRLTTLPLITHVLPLDAYEEAVELMESDDPSVGKVLLRPGVRAAGPDRDRRAVTTRTAGQALP